METIKFYCEDVGMAEAADSDHLDYAARAGHVMVSHDEDFLRLHYEWQAIGKTHAGIMRISPILQGPRNIGRIVEELLTYYEVIAEGAGTIEDDIENQVIFIR